MALPLPVAQRLPLQPPLAARQNCCTVIPHIGRVYSMDREYYAGNRSSVYRRLPEGSLLLLFSGAPPRKTGDEYYPFFTDRNFLYLAGIEQPSLTLLAAKSGGELRETLFILPSDAQAERWNGPRVTAEAAAVLSAITDIRYDSEWTAVLQKLACSGNYDYLYLDLDKLTDQEPDNAAYRMAAQARSLYPYLTVKNVRPLLRACRTVKQPCEIAAMRRAEDITRGGILAMMAAARPGLYEYQLKAEWDYALAQRGVPASGFPPIISAGANNFCIHYYAYSGQCRDGDLVLNDVGAAWDHLCTDVSRGWPVNGKFSERQRLLYECAYATSNQMFSIFKPGLLLSDADALARRYNYERLHEIGLCKSWEDIGAYMWHGGAHQVGYDVHDVDPQYTDPGQLMLPGMVFCVDIGIYCQEWGIGFRLEDNCLITENGCENLSAAIPRSIQDIEACLSRP